MEKIIFTDQMIYDIDKMEVLDFAFKYKISRNVVCQKRKELGIKNKGFFKIKKPIIKNGIEYFICRMCKEEKTRNLFTKEKDTKTEIGSLCKECQKIKSKTKYSKESYKRSNREYRRKQRSENPDVKIINNIRRGIFRFLKIKNRLGKSKYEEILGCSIKNLMIYLESKFTPEMTWENYGSYWHVDHIIPQRAFSIEQLNNCWNYTNLQPLEARLNFSKNDRLFDGSRARDL